MRARIGSRHFDQNLRQPIRGIDHPVVAGSGRLEGAPRLVGLALCEYPVEGWLRIVRGADIALLRHLLARAGEPDGLQRHAVWLRGELRIDPGAILLVDMKRLRLGRRTAGLALSAAVSRAWRLNSAAKSNPRWPFSGLNASSHTIEEMRSGTCSMAPEPGQPP